MYQHILMFSTLLFVFCSSEGKSLTNYAQDKNLDLSGVLQTIEEIINANPEHRMAYEKEKEFYNTQLYEGKGNDKLSYANPSYKLSSILNEKEKKSGYPSLLYRWDGGKRSSFDYLIARLSQLSGAQNLNGRPMRLRFGGR